MRIFGIIVMAVVVFPDETRATPPGLMDWYNTIQDFMGTLHEVLQVGADKVSEFDERSAERIRDIEYNWLSLIGYYKGMTPLISDFYFNYFTNDQFRKKNGGLNSSLHGLIYSFTVNEDEPAICRRLEILLDSTLRIDLFAEGAIKSFLQDVDGLVSAKKACLVVIKEARARASHISDFLHFVAKGSKRPTTKNAPRKDVSNSEL